MFIIINDNKLISTYNISDNNSIEYKSIRIYPKNNEYYIALKDNCYLINNTKIEKLKIKEYIIKSNDYFYNIHVYAYESDLGFNDYKLYKNCNFIVAKDDKANIVCNDSYLQNHYLSYINKQLKSDYDFSVNGNKYTDISLKEGDIIEYVGIKIVYFDDFLYINNFNVDIKLKPYTPKLQLIKYQTVTNPPNFYVLDEIYDLKIDELKEYEKISPINHHEFIKSLTSNTVMVISTICMAIIGLYSQFLTGQLSASSYSYLIMPISIIFTALLLPIIFYLIEKRRNKKAVNKSITDYIKYLEQYKIDLNEKVDKYVSSYNNRYFDLLNCKDKVFYARKNLQEYLTISIGKISKSFDFTYKQTNIKDIDEYLLKIKKRLNDIDDFPLFLDLKNNRVVTIVTKKSLKQFYFHKTLLELAYKHHYDDIGIAIYSRDLNIINDIYNLPHLFFHNKRLTLNSNKQLIDLDQGIYDKPIILLATDYIDYQFTNKSIIVIYFSSNDSELLKDSDAVVCYENNKGYLLKDRKIEFVYYEADIEFKPYFQYLGRFKTIGNKEKAYRFMDICGDIKSNYLNNDKYLKAFFSYNNNELLCLDLHESKHGPHGLIGGSTGSGKSELIVSLLLSLCLRYSAAYLNIVLIDYKGGGIKESLSYNGQVMPHIVASVSNLENNVLERLIVALNKECLRRQKLFKELSAVAHKSIMNIDDYLSNSREMLSHLLIVVDEFAELKKENPETIKELISISRIGRSLGVHLILATQKPGGVIDDEIWSNSHFKIALKVFEEKDSQDLIKCKDAAYLSDVGSFLLQVDASLLKAQSIYSKNDIYDNDPYKVSLLDNNLLEEKTFKKEIKIIVQEASYLTKSIIDIHSKLNIRPKNIEFLPSEPMNRLKLVKEPCLAFGEIDDYLNCNKGLLAYSLNDSLLIYSSRAKEINGILNTLSQYNRGTIVIGNREYQNTYISDSLTYDNEEDIIYLFNKLIKHPDYDLTLVIQDLSCFLSYNENYSEYLYKLIRISNNISFIFLTTNSQLGFKIINCFDNKIMINIGDISNLSNFYAMKGRYKGNSFFFNEEPIPFVPIKEESLITQKSIIDRIIKVIPQSVFPECNDEKYLAGYDLLNREAIYIDKNTVVTSLDDNYLNIYKKAYPSISVIKYSHNIVKKNRDILWLGSGLFSQRLINNINNDIEYNQALLIKDNKKYVLKGLDYAWSFIEN